MKGWKTIITNGVVLLGSLAAGYGMDIPAAEQTAVATGIIAIVNIGLRFATTTAVGAKE